MLEKNKRTAVEELSLIMRRKLRRDKIGNADIINSLGWLNSEGEEKNQRAADFEFVNQKLNELMQSPSDLPPQYRDVALLAQDLDGKKIPTLEEARQRFYASDKTAAIVTSTMNRAADEYSSWAKIDSNYPSQGTPISGVLIEGFGFFLGTSTLMVTDDAREKLQTSRHYVLAFEAVLISEKPNSPLVGDVIGWMKEEVA